jgi:PAS domain S-box-containing protein
VSSSIVEPSLAARALAAAGDAIITVDTAGRITSWNEAAQRLLGYSPQDAIGQTLALIIPPEHRPRHIAGFQAAIDSGRLAHNGAIARVEAATASGARLALGLSLGLLHPEGGKPVGVVAVLRPLGEAVVQFVNAASRPNGAV